jgi:outer membrane protein OmpA-like peptidoglycan-associated protein
MKKTGFALLMVSLLGWAQQPQPPAQPRNAVRTAPLAIATAPNPYDLYCSGFISDNSVPRSNVVIAGEFSPEESQFAGTTGIFIRGAGMKVGDRYELVRLVKDVNHYEAFPGQASTLFDIGKTYFELGLVRVVEVHNNIAVVKFELSCAPTVPGDFAIPAPDRPAPPFRKVKLDRYAPPSGKSTGRIIEAQDFDSEIGTGQKAYLNIGEDKGLKPGDYVRITRTYNYSQHHDISDSLSFKARYTEETQKAPLPGNVIPELPPRTLGDAMVLHVHPKSATVMIVGALEDIHVGDGAELMDVSEAPAPAPVAAAPSEPAVASPPTITCSASPVNVPLDQSSTITCNAASPDNRPVTITFKSSSGTLAVNRNVAVLNTSTTGPGQVTVRGIATDDRQLSASSAVSVNVEPPPPVPTAQKMTDLDFAPNSAYVNNRAKAVLDDVALKLQQDPQSTALLSGSTVGKEPQTLALRRAENAKTYLTKSKGIDGKRLQTRAGAKPGDAVEVWTLPPGASTPQ